MKKPSLTDALAQKTTPAPPEFPDRMSRNSPASDRINTTLRISPAGLEALKNVAAAKRIRVNDLLLGELSTCWR